MAKSFEELMELYGSNKIGNADMALGRNNPGALETILKERQNWANATTQEEKTAALGSDCLGNVEFKHLCNWGFINGFCIGGVLCWEILRQWIACSLIFVNFIV